MLLLGFIQLIIYSLIRHVVYYGTTKINHIIIFLWTIDSFKTGFVFVTLLRNRNKTSAATGWNRIFRVTPNDIQHINVSENTGWNKGVKLEGAQWNSVSLPLMAVKKHPL